MSGRETVYWDSCIFITWFNKQPRTDPTDMFGIETLVNQIDSGQISLTTSTLTFSEVLASYMSDQNFQEFRKLFSRRNCFLIDVTREIAEISHDIRNYYSHDGNNKLRTPDCIHLATAIWFKCKKLYTFDGEGNKPNKLLTLKQPIANLYKLEIEKPQINKNSQLTFEII